MHKCLARTRQADLYVKIKKDIGTFTITVTLGSYSSIRNPNSTMLAHDENTFDIVLNSWMTFVLKQGCVMRNHQTCESTVPVVRIIWCRDCRIPTLYYKSHGLEPPFSFNPKNCIFIFRQRIIYHTSIHYVIQAQDDKKQQMFFPKKQQQGHNKQSSAKDRRWKETV
jgi:hypothetical protein